MNSALGQLPENRLVLGHPAGQSGLVEARHYVEPTIAFMRLPEKFDKAAVHAMSRQ